MTGKRYWLVLLIAVAVLAGASSAWATHNPHLGRFMQRDPAGYRDGMNSCQYQGTSPLAHVDPRGTKRIKGANGYGDWEYIEKPNGNRDAKSITIKFHPNAVPVCCDKIDFLQIARIWMRDMRRHHSHRWDKPFQIKSGWVIDTRAYAYTAWWNTKKGDGAFGSAPDPIKAAVLHDAPQNEDEPERWYHFETVAACREGVDASRGIAYGSISWGFRTETLDEIRKAQGNPKKLEYRSMRKVWFKPKAQSVPSKEFWAVVKKWNVAYEYASKKGLKRKGPGGKRVDMEPIEVSSP
jgi:hypothetical protein